MSEADYCELCDLPQSQCIHGQPPAAPEPARPKAPRTTTRKRTPRSSSPGVSAATAPRRWTSPDELKPAVIAVLRDADGELPAEDVYDRLEELLTDRFRPGDHETTPEGELRWRFAARRARQGLIREGEMVKAGPGVWKLA